MARPISQRLGASDEDYIRTFEGSARRNYRDADRLRLADRRLGAIYLYGYAVEMWVKAAHFRAYFQHLNHPADTRITGAIRAAAAGTWQAIGAPHPPGPHDIEGWAWLLVRRRADLPNPYPQAFATEIVDRAADVYLNWKEYMRYRAIPVGRGEVVASRSNAAWFRRNYPNL